jgi:hypothetical protein
LQVPVILGVSELKERALLAHDARDKVVKDVEVALARSGGLRYAGSLKVVLYRFETAESPAIVELELGVVTESRRIVIGECVRVSKGLEDELGTCVSSERGVG